MAFNLTVEMGGLVIFAPAAPSTQMRAMDHKTHRLCLYFEPRWLDEANSSLGPIKLETTSSGERFFELRKNWTVHFPGSNAMPAPPSDARDYDEALPITQLGLTGLKPNPALCGGLTLPAAKSYKGTFGELPGAYTFPATGDRLSGIGDKIFWRARYNASYADLEVKNPAGGKPLGTLRVATKGSEVTVKASCVGGLGGNPFDEHKGLEKAATGTYQAPTKHAIVVLHVGSGSCPPGRYP